MNKRMVLIVMLVAILGIFASGCVTEQAKSDSGVKKASVQIQTGSDGLTAEQRNIKDRLVHDNKPGAMEYLYVFSSLSGQIMYSDVVKGKVTSSGKRLTPRTVSDNCRGSGCGMGVIINGNDYNTPEVIEDDGTYGDSVPYLYYWDTKGVYHQIYISGGQMVMVSDQPISVNGVIASVENVNGSK